MIVLLIVLNVLMLALVIALDVLGAKMHEADPHKKYVRWLVGVGNFVCVVMSLVLLRLALKVWWGIEF